MAKERPIPDLLLCKQRLRSRWTKPLLFAGAALAGVLGIVCWIVPVTSGIPLFIVGIFLLGRASVRARGWINRAERRLPKWMRLKLRRGIERIHSERLRAMMCLPSLQPAPVR